MINYSNVKWNLNFKSITFLMNLVNRDIWKYVSEKLFRCLLKRSENVKTLYECAISAAMFVQTWLNHWWWSLSTHNQTFTTEILQEPKVITCRGTYYESGPKILGILLNFGLCRFWCLSTSKFPDFHFQGWMFEVWLFALYSNNCVMYVKQLCMFTLVVNHLRVDFLPKTPLIFRSERWWGLNPFLYFKETV